MTTDAPPMLLPAAIPRHRFSVEDFKRMHEIGVFDEDDRVELIEGIVIDLHPVGGPHVWVSGRLNGEVLRQTDRTYMISINNPLILRSDTLPLVDLAIIRASYNTAELPTAPDAVLVGEIADVSLDYDRTVKFPLYAEAGIPEAWIFDLVTGWIERHTDPVEGRYRQTAVAGRGERLTSTVLPSLTIDVDEVLGTDDA